MQIFSGQSISSDVVFGPLHFLTPAPPTISAHSPLPPEEEWERFSTAHRQAVLELAQLYDQAVQMVGEKLATIFAIHAMLLDDQDYQDTVYSMIFSCGCTAAGKYHGVDSVLIVLVIQEHGVDGKNGGQLFPHHLDSLVIELGQLQYCLAVSRGEALPLLFWREGRMSRYRRRCGRKEMKRAENDIR